MGGGGEGQGRGDFRVAGRTEGESSGTATPDDDGRGRSPGVESGPRRAENSPPSDSCKRSAAPAQSQFDCQPSVRPQETGTSARAPTTTSGA